MRRSTALAPSLVVLGAVLALGLTACDREVRIMKKEERVPLKTIARLDCPEAQGDLKRVSAAADGKTCVYSAKDQTDVSLRLIAINGDENAALAPIEAELRTLVPPPAPKPPEPPEAPTAPKGRNIDKGDNENAHIRLPGLSIDSEGDHAQIRMGGLHIEGKGDHANINISRRRGGDVSIVADDGGASIRQNRSNERGIHRSLIFANDAVSPAGYHLVGYEARGPKAGPLVVAVVRAKEDQGDADYVFKDMKALVARNVGR
jgi:hypothetical protein